MFESPTRIETAARIAQSAHEGQIRKNDKSPYIIHPFMCAMMLAQHGFDEAVIAAALVHDVLEDADISEQELRTLLGDEVVDIVTAVSEDKTLPWEERKAQYVEHVRTAPFETKAVSIADKIHNMKSLLFSYEQHGAEIWKSFNRGREKKLWFEELCLAMFKDSFEHPLTQEYESLVAQMRVLD